MSAAAAEAPAFDPLESYRGDTPGRAQGHEQAASWLQTDVLTTSDESVTRNRLSTDEIDDYLAYCGWNLWDIVATRSTEGESGLIPRQEYETVAFVQQWLTYPRFYEALLAEVGVDGLLELCRTPRREPASKLNHVRAWATMCPLIGRGLAIKLGLHTAADRLHELNTTIQFARRVQHAVHGPGHAFVSGRGYEALVLGDEWLTRFKDEEVHLEDEDQLKAFRQFNAQTELFGFLLHFDNRNGLCDTGPYPLEDGGFLIVRDHFLYETAYFWSQAAEGLPHCVTQAMFFRPDADIEVVVNDIGTIFTKPRNYLKHLSGVAVYARDRWDTPASEIRPVDADEQAEIVNRCRLATGKLYAQIAAMSRRERILAGVQVYTREFVMPYARAAGIWDHFVTEMDFDELHPQASEAYYRLTTGAANELLPGVFLLGEGFPPVGERPTW